MIIGYQNEPEAISQMIHPSPDLTFFSTDGEFLWQHLRKDIQLIRKALGKSQDDTFIFLHLLLKRLLIEQQIGLQIILNKISQKVFLNYLKILKFLYSFCRWEYLIRQLLANARLKRRMGNIFCYEFS